MAIFPESFVAKKKNWCRRNFYFQKEKRKNREKIKLK